MSLHRCGRFLFLPAWAFTSFLLFWERNRYSFPTTRLQDCSGRISSLLTGFFSSQVPIELYVHNAYSIPFVESMNQFWHQPIKTVEQKTSKLNHESLEFGAWSFLQEQGYFGVGTGDGGNWEEPCTDGENRRSNHGSNSYLPPTLVAYSLYC